MTMNLFPESFQQVSDWGYYCSPCGRVYTRALVVAEGAPHQLYRIKVPSADVAGDLGDSHLESLPET